MKCGSVVRDAVCVLGCSREDTVRNAEGGAVVGASSAAVGHALGETLGKAAEVEPS